LTTAIAPPSRRQPDGRFESWQPVVNLLGDCGRSDQFMTKTISARKQWQSAA